MHNRCLGLRSLRRLLAKAVPRCCLAVALGLPTLARADDPPEAPQEPPTFYIFGYVTPEQRASVAAQVQAVEGELVTDLEPGVGFVVMGVPRNVNNDMISPELVQGAFSDATADALLRTHAARRVPLETASTSLASVLEQEASEQRVVRERPARRVDGVGNFTLRISGTPGYRLFIDGAEVVPAAERAAERDIQLLLQPGRHRLWVESPDAARAECDLRTKEEGRATVLYGAARREDGRAEAYIRVVSTNPPPN